MSNLWLNIRFGTVHLQWGRRKWLPKLRYNPVHKGTKFKIEVYDFRSLF